MARKPNHKELDLYDYSGVVSGRIKVETNAQDKIGRYVEQVLADKCEAKLNLFEEPDLPEVGVNIKSGGQKVAQNTIGTIVYRKFSDMTYKDRYDWFKKHTESWHYVPREDDLGMTGGSYNINASEGTYAGELYKQQFEEICEKIDKLSKVDLDIDDRNYPRVKSNDKGMWAEFDKEKQTWRFRQSRKNRRRIEARDNKFNDIFE